jgi:hypothetical protein
MAPNGMRLVLAAAALAARHVVAEVPLIGWSATEGVFGDAESIRAGAPLPIQLVVDSHLETTTAKGTTVVLFTIDQLSIDDITRYGAKFSNLRSAMATARSTILAPSVVGMNVASQLREALVAQAKQSGAESLSVAAADVEETLSGLDTAPAVLVVSLPPVSASSDKAVALAESDTTIGLTLEKLAAMKARTVLLLTAAQDGRAATSRSRRGVSLQSVYGEASKWTRPVSKAIKVCQVKWPGETTSNYKSRVQNSKSCRPGHVPGETQLIPLFTTPILMGLTMSLFMTMILMIGMYGVMNLQTNDRFPNVDDIPIIVSVLNE